jgi:hypothetical protein
LSNHSSQSSLESLSDSSAYSVTPSPGTESILLIGNLDHARNEWAQCVEFATLMVCWPQILVIGIFQIDTHVPPRLSKKGHAANSFRTAKRALSIVSQPSTGATSRQRFARVFSCVLHLNSQSTLYTNTYLHSAHRAVRP